MAATRHAEKRPLIPATASLAFTTALADPENFTVPQQKRGHKRRPPALRHARPKRLRRRPRCNRAVERDQERRRTASSHLRDKKEEEEVVEANIPQTRKQVPALQTVAS
jgi:Mg-chelatase subunit ChlD